MKFLVLAYGDEKDWNALSQQQKDALLAQDDVLRKRGDLVAAVERPITIRNSNGLTKTDGPFMQSRLPLAGFGVIEAKDLEEAIALVKETPCARANGAVEVWPFLDTTRT